MVKIKDSGVERRRYIRLVTPIDISYMIPDTDSIHKAITKNISADGLRFEAHDRTLNESAVIEIRLNMPGATNPVHVKGRIMWKKRLSLEDKAPHDFGVEFTEIEEDNKNTFLRFFCDLIYDLSRESKNANKKN